MKKVLIVLAYTVFYPIWMVLGLLLHKSVSRVKYQWTCYKVALVRAHEIANRSK